MRSVYFFTGLLKGKHPYLMSVLLLIIFLFIPGYSQIILTEIMFDADTLESHNEFVEVYNAGDITINLAGWKIGDEIELDNLVETSQGLDLLPGQYAVILDGSYFGNSTIYDALIPSEALVIKIDDGSFGSFGWSNSNPEPVKLVNPAGDTVQTYIYSIDNSPGFSDEKIHLNNDNSPENWGNSTHFRGTPGFRNSIAPYNFDVKIDSLWTTPDYPREYESFQIHSLIKNSGLNYIELITITIFNDFNNNQMADPGEAIFDSNVSVNLMPGDTLNFQADSDGLSSGSYLFGVILQYDQDENPENDFGFLEFTVENSAETLVINEIMYRPISGKSEWVELYNGSLNSIKLQNWSLADSRDTCRVVDVNAYINGQDYFVISADSTIFDTFSVPDYKITIVKSFPTLNNDYDDLKILSPSGRIVDRVTYSDSWMGREVEAGISLERINPLISSSLAKNWAASVNLRGGTPGELNSVFVEKKTSESLVNIEPNPFSPDGDGFEDVTILDYSLPILTGFLTIDIYDITGRRIKQLTNRLPVSQKGQVIWDGKNENGRVSRIGLYIIVIRVYDPSQNLFKELKKTVVLTKK
jgi:hypothetical protein